MKPEELVELANEVATDEGIEIPEEPVTTEPIAEGGEAPEVEAVVAEPVVETETKPETKTEVPSFDWTGFTPDKSQIAPAPEPNEDGIIDFEATKRHFIDSAKAELRAEEAFTSELNRQLGEAETILPQMKTNPKIAALVRNEAMVATQEGRPLDLVGAAKTIADEFGVVRAEATQNANVSITEAENAVIGGGSSQVGPTTSKEKELEARVNNGDESAIEEILDMWTADGVIS